MDVCTPKRAHIQRHFTNRDSGGRVKGGGEGKRRRLALGSRGERDDVRTHLERSATGNAEMVRVVMAI